MGEILKQNYEELYWKKPAGPHYWVMIYNNNVIGEYDTFPKLMAHYRNYKSCLKDDERELLTFGIRFKE